MGQDLVDAAAEHHITAEQERDRVSHGLILPQPRCGSMQPPAVTLTRGGLVVVPADVMMPRDMLVGAGADSERHGNW
jgi:hypothetical protein